MIESELPLSLYVHTPWCIKKCPYCDFNSHEYLEGGSRNQTLPWSIQKEYLRCLKLDLDEEIRRLRMLRPELGEAAKPRFLPSLLVVERQVYARQRFMMSCSVI